jgi:hypothetical protein
MTSKELFICPIGLIGQNCSNLIACKKVIRALLEQRKRNEQAIKAYEQRVAELIKKDGEHISQIEDALEEQPVSWPLPI